MCYSLKGSGERCGICFMRAGQQRSIYFSGQVAAFRRAERDETKSVEDGTGIAWMVTGQGRRGGGDECTHGHSLGTGANAASPLLSGAALRTFWQECQRVRATGRE